MKDGELLDKMHDRSDAAIDVLNTLYGPYCRSIAFHILRNDEDVEECLNDVYIKVWDAAAKREISDLKYYIAATTRNTAVKILNKRVEQTMLKQELIIHEELEECFGARDDVAAVTDAIVIRETLDAFLKTLSPTERWVFMRRYWNMDSVKVIAEICGKREAAIRMMLSRTRKKLKIQLEKEGINL